MPIYQIKTLLVVLLLLFTRNSFAQKKGIIISKSLATNSEPMKVKPGTQKIGKIWNFKFGDYAVTESKMGWTKTSSKSNLFNTKSESKTTQKSLQ